MAHQAYPPQAYPPAPGAHPGAPPVGHGPPPFHPPPITPETLAMLQQFWTHADNDRSGSISSAELASLPFPGRGPFAGKQIGPQAAGMLVQTFDRTHTAQLNWDTFCYLFQWLEAMQMHFYQADRDMGGTLDLAEVPAALWACGYQLPPAELKMALDRHSAGSGQLSFFGFMALVCELQAKAAGVVLSGGKAGKKGKKDKKAGKKDKAGKKGKAGKAGKAGGKPAKSAQGCANQ